ncbi:hypothetical protein HDA44_003665 [Kribbella solani]|uniref:Uncharacterized protein n=1 Tax=Kribbella solani TaxID=236067 RepID=A0A841DMH4_9ACTN|nr:hypothetical protein [Kribbella solani]
MGIGDGGVGGVVEGTGADGAGGVVEGMGAGGAGGVVEVVWVKVMTLRPMWIRSPVVRRVGAVRRRPFRPVPLRDSSCRVQVAPSRVRRAWMREIWSSAWRRTSAFEARPMVNVSASVGNCQRCSPSDSTNSVSTHTPAGVVLIEFRPAVAEASHPRRRPTRLRDSAIHTRTRPPADPQPRNPNPPPQPSATPPLHTHPRNPHPTPTLRNTPATHAPTQPAPHANPPRPAGYPGRPPHPSARAAGGPTTSVVIH